MFNLSFLNPGIIAFSLAAIVPILIYLFAKKKPKKIIFSSIKFIKATSQKNKQKMNLKNLLLLLIRILIILFTILAIARPTIKTDYLKSSDHHPKTAVAIIIDNSYSMSFLVDTQTALEIAKDQLNVINGIISDDDIIVLFTLDDSWNNLNGNVNFGKLSNKLIESIAITPIAQKLPDVIKLAEIELAKSQLPNREIIILSDLQAKTLPSKTEIPTYYIPSHNQQNLQNISVQNSKYYYDLIDRKLKNSLRFDICNHTNQPQNDLICRIFMDNNTIAEKVISLNAHQTKQESFDLNLQEKAFHSGFIEVVNERLTYDNKNYFAFQYDPNPTLAIISDLDKLPKPLEALAAIYSNNYQIISQPEFDELKNFEAILLFKKDILTTKTKFILDKIQQDKGIVFVTNKNLDIKWREYLEDKFQVDFGKFYSSTGNSQTLTSASRFHPITNAFKLRSGIAVNDFWELKTDDNILLESDKYPIIVSQEKSILWNFDLESMRNPLLVNSVFPVLAYNSLNYISSNNIARNYLVGDRMNLSNEIILPSNNALNTSSITFSEPGIYKTDRNSFAVNIDYKESNWETLDYEGDIIFLENENWQNQIISSRYGFEIWKYLLFLVIMLFIIEMLIVKTIEKRNS